jgi:hypothetical protein
VAPIYTISAISPSTFTHALQVVQQLRMADANMAHCKLGRRGAQALRHALSTNTVISTLNLADNGLDAQVRRLPREMNRPL